MSAPPEEGAVAFRDRNHAGRELAALLGRHAGRPDLVVLGLPRGGLPVADEVAAALHAPLDAFLVRKLGVPGHRELAMGAIASGGVRVLNETVVRAAAIPPEEIERVAAEELVELERRERAYRGARPAPAVRDRTAILVDDGLATGSTMRAAVGALRRARAQAVVAAVPVAPPQACAALEPLVDEFVCVRMPEPFGAVGAWYEDFSQVDDDEVRALLERAAARS